MTLAEIADSLRSSELVKANQTLSVFHRIRRNDVDSGKAPTIKDSLAAMSTSDRG